jgi:hypothetical protein
LGKRLPLIVGLGLACIAWASMWFYTNDVLRQHQIAEAAEHNRPRGNLSDLYPRWLGARELILRARNPYGADITREIQTGYYGRPIDPALSNDPKDQQAFAYPVYVVFVLAPTVELPFGVVQRGFWWLLVIVTAASVLLWLRALGWRISVSAAVLWIVLTLGSFPAIQGLKLQQLTLLVAGLLAGALSAVAGGYFFLAGVLLAVAAIKPQLVVLMAAVLCIWTLGNWRERQRLLWGLGWTMLLMILAGEILLPGWISKFRAASAAYWRYTGGGRSVLDVQLGPTLGRIVSVILVAVLIYFAWRLRRVPVQSLDFGWLLALTMATTLMVIPMFAPYNQLLLIPVFMVVVREIRRLWEAGRLSRLLVVLTALSVFWPWVAAAGLVAALFFVPGSVVQKEWALPLLTNFWIPTLALGLVFIGRRMMAAPE